MSWLTIVGTAGAICLFFFLMMIAFAHDRCEKCPHSCKNCPYDKSNGYA